MTALATKTREGLETVKECVQGVAAASGRMRRHVAGGRDDGCGVRLQRGGECAGSKGRRVWVAWVRCASSMLSVSCA